VLLLVFDVGGVGVAAGSVLTSLPDGGPVKRAAVRNGARATPTKDRERR
jgi:hypothetical protein